MTQQPPVAWGCFKDGELQSELVGTKTDVDFWVASDEPHMQGMVAGPLYTTLRAALAEPVEEPVAWHYTNNGGGNVMHWGPSARLDADIQAAKDYPRVHKVTPLYLAPPQRKPLTDEEIQELSQQHKFYSRMEKFVRIIERAHGIGGNDD